MNVDKRIPTRLYRRHLRHRAQHIAEQHAREVSIEGFADAVFLEHGLAGIHLDEDLERRKRGEFREGTAEEFADAPAFGGCGPGVAQTEVQGFEERAVAGRDQEGRWEGWEVLDVEEGEGGVGVEEVGGFGVE